MKKHMPFVLSALLLFSITVRAQNESTDAVFIKESASRNLMEVELGRLAQQKATLQQVKDFGRMMERDHSDANQKLMGVSVKLGMSPPSKMLDGDRAKVLEFINKPGNQFEKDYIDLMMSQYNVDIIRFQKALNDANSSDLKQWISGTLSLLKEHAMYAENLHSRIKH
jgi:putative membrane protein